MAVLRIQENIKKADETYDVVHKETEASLVLFDDNETFQQKYDAGELNGETGESAYQQAVAGGYTGTEDEFKAVLASGPWLPTAGGTLDGNLTVQDIRIPTDFDRPILLGLSGDGTRFAIHVPRSSSDSNILFMQPRADKVSIGGIADPVNENDVANKKYVDDSVASFSDRILANLLLFSYDQIDTGTWGYVNLGNFRSSSFSDIGTGITVELIRCKSMDDPVFGAYYIVNGPIVVDNIAYNRNGPIKAFALLPQDNSKYVKHYTPMSSGGYTNYIYAIYMQNECTSFNTQRCMFGTPFTINSRGEVISTDQTSRENKSIVTMYGSSGIYADSLILPQLGVYLNE